jgi:conserved hypothetical protein
MKYNPIKVIWIVLGTICLILGSIGIILPILPTVPFFLATLFCYGNSSETLKQWFINTRVYKKNLESYVKKEGMNIKTKLSIIISVTIMMSIGFIMMKGVPVGRIIITVIWICHFIYFIFIVKTVRD